jgi:hypothetical protein
MRPFAIRCQTSTVVRIRCRRGVPHPRQILGEGEDPCAVGVGELELVRLARVAVCALQRVELPELVVPLLFQGPGDDAVVGVDRLVAALGEPRLVPRPLEAELPLLIHLRGLPLGFANDGKAELDLGRLDRGQEEPGDGLIDGSCQDEPAVPMLAAVLERSMAVIASTCETPDVADMHLAAAFATQGQSLKQGVPLTGSAALIRAPRRGVVAQLVLIGHELLPRDVGRMMVPQAHCPFVRSLLWMAVAPHLAVHERRALLITSVGVGPCVERVAKHAADETVAWSRPSQIRNRRVARRHLEAMTDEVPDDREGAAVDSKSLEDQAHRALDVLVRIEAKAALRLVPHVADRRGQTKRAASGLVQLSAIQAQTHPGLLGLAHGALEPEEQPIIGGARGVDRLLVDQDDVRQPAEIQQPIPVRRAAGQSGHLEGEDGADAAAGHVFGEALEPAPPLGARTALPEILVDDVNALGGPSELDRASLESVLARCRLRMLADLTRIGLAQIDDGVTLQVVRLDLADHDAPPRRLRPEAA